MLITDLARLWRHHLKPTGWARTRREGKPVTADGRPVPWLAPAAVHLLDRLPVDVRVFEWGAGQSTLWWQERGSEIVSVEDDARWAAPGVIVRAVDNGYLEEITRHGLFDVVVIDGKERSRCAELAPAHLTERGVVVFDNTNRAKHAEGIAHLEQSFSHLPLVGLALGEVVEQTTSIFYRPGNVLGL